MRGLKWYSMRDRDGNLPKGVENTEKMNDVNTYTEFIQGKDEGKVGELLKKLSLMARSAKKRLPEYKRLLETLNSIGAPRAKVKK